LNLEDGQVLSRLGFPPIGQHRRFVTAIGIDAIGSGVWIPVSILYFVAVTPLTLVQIGLALSISSGITLPLALGVGQIVDRYGAKRVLQWGNVLQAVGFAAYPFANSLGMVCVVTGVAAIGRTAFWGSYSPMVAAISLPGERERWFGFLGALRNSGFAIGGLLAGAAITIGSTAAYTAVVLLNSGSYVIAFVLMLGVAAHQAEGPAHDAQTGGWAEVLRDRGYRWLVASNFAYASTCMALNVMMPVYIVEVLHLPGWVSGAVFVINTVMIGVAQGLAVNAMTGAIRSRIVVLGAGFTAVSFVLLYAAHGLSVALAIAVVLAAAVVYTVGEMAAGPVLSSLAAESPPVHLRGRYLAAYQLSWNGSSALAPLLFTWLLGLGSLPAWSGLVVIAVLGAACCQPMRRSLPLAALPITNAPFPA
jgi:MFS family permease